MGLAPADGCTEGLALALMIPEPSGDDRTLVALECESGLARSRFRGALDAAGFTVRATWSHSVGERDLPVGYLAEVDGFVTPESPALAVLAAALGEAAPRMAVIGAFAVPPRAGPGPQSAAPPPGEGS